MGLSFKRAEESEREELRAFHIENHLDETAHFPGEREGQEADLEVDFPQLYDPDYFSKGHIFLVQDQSKIVGCIGLFKAAYRDSDAASIDTGEIWLNTFSVAKSLRGKGIGSKLVQFALSLNTVLSFDTVRLVTLANHSESSVDVMGAARKLYEKNGFKSYKSERFDYGKGT